jgi:hypothetical protein
MRLPGGASGSGKYIYFQSKQFIIMTGKLVVYYSGVIKHSFLATKQIPHLPPLKDANLKSHNS